MVSNRYKKHHVQLFQGNLHKKHYFEGWYHKIVDPLNQTVYAIIPGIALDSKSDTSHAFIQILNGTNAKYIYLRYPLSNWKISHDKSEIWIDANHFFPSGVTLNINTPEIQMRGTLLYSDMTPLPYYFGSPNIMGPFAYLPFLECYHGIVSMNHHLIGSLQIDQKEIDFTHGKGYVEKDWGKGFPSQWIWMQSNHFLHPQRSIMLSLAKIPFLGKDFTGVIAAIWDQGKIYRFGTYNGARISSLAIDSRTVDLKVIRGQYEINILAKKAQIAQQSDTALMLAPIKGKMQGKCAESMTSTITIRFMHKNQVIFEDLGSLAGFEIMGSNVDFHQK